MTEAEFTALLDVHDGLVRACVERGLPLAEFVSSYGDFPQGHGLDDGPASAEHQRMLERSSARVAFHRRVAGLLSGLAAGETLPTGLPSGADRFLEKAVFMRLRHLVERYPDCRVIGGIDSGSAAR
jgi:hypothetical protein